MYIITIQLEDVVETHTANSIRECFITVESLSCQGCNVTIVGHTRFWFFSL